VVKSALKKQPKILGMQYISGVEISVTWCSKTVHIVGLGIDHTNTALIEGLYQTRNGRTNRAKAIAAQLDQIGIKNAYEGALEFVGNPELDVKNPFRQILGGLWCLQRHQ
jgi:3',5'-nucleoside bisphosphate phosphatase